MKLLRCLCLLSILASTLPAQAAHISDTVIVGSQEWAQVDLFTNVSWNDLNSQCPGGVCTLSSAINGYDLDGWTWASNEAVQSLFNVFTGRDDLAPSQFSERNSTWAPEFFSLFHATSPPSLSDDYLSNDLMGWSFQSLSDDSAYIPGITDALVSIRFDSVRTAGYLEKNQARDDVGAWFVRNAQPAQVPVPAILPLLGLGLAGLWMARRKGSAKV